MEETMRLLVDAGIPAMGVLPCPSRHRLRVVDASTAMTPNTVAVPSTSILVRRPSIEPIMGALGRRPFGLASRQESTARTTHGRASSVALAATPSAIERDLVVVVEAIRPIKVASRGLRGRTSCLSPPIASRRGGSPDHDHDGPHDAVDTIATDDASSIGCASDIDASGTKTNVPTEANTGA